MFSSVQSDSDDDARVADAQRFVAEVEQMVAGLRPGEVLPRLDRIDGPDSSGTAHAVVDSVGRFVDLRLDPGWWAALGPARVATGLLEALACARLKAALVPLILRRHGVQPPSPVEQVPPLPPPEDEDFLDAARSRIADAYRLIDDAEMRSREQPALRTIVGPSGLFRLYARGGHIEGADVAQHDLSPDDTDRLVADAREALTELSLSRAGSLGAWGAH